LADIKETLYADAAMNFYWRTQPAECGLKAHLHQIHADGYDLLIWTTCRRLHLDCRRLLVL